LAEPSADQRPLVLLDGMSLAFRAFFALSPEIATSSGLATNALHGFAAMVHSLVRTQSPRAVIVAFDLPGGTFRDDMSEDYKGGRAETPVEIEHQFDLIRELCEVLHVPVLGVPRFEADDVLATLATRARDESIPAIVVTGDRDTFQLVEDPFVRVLYNRRGVSDYALYDEAGIVERCGVEPARYPLLAALRGDPSDNLPGVPGVGEKTAAKLLSQYRDFDELYAHLDELTPKLRENLAAHEALARNNERVMRLVRDVPLDVDVAALHLGGWHRGQVASFFDRYEMTQMRTRFEKLLADGLLGEPSHNGDEAPSPAASELPAPRPASLAEASRPGRATAALVGERVALYQGATGATAVVGLDELLTAPPSRLAGHDAKALWRRAAEAGADLGEVSDDGAIMAFLIDSVHGRYDLDDVAERYLGEAPSAAPSLFDAAADDDVARERAYRAARVIERLAPEIDAWGLERVYREIELPLVRVLARMESRGVRVDVAMLKSINEEFADEARHLDAEIQRVAGHEFTVNSPQQLQRVLFDELGLTAVKKIKTGYSTDAQSLEAIAHEHEIVPLILRYREVEKLRSTYGGPLIDTVGPDSRIHATFHQTVARTGRLSSDNPNLHNIPVRSEEGRRLRYAFVPEAGWRLAVADYNQIELRILAHLSQDAGLLGAFASHADVHRAIASSVFGVSPEEVTPAQREQAKAVSYGLAYGMEAYGLSQRLAIPVADARAIMDRYFAGFPSLKAYMESTLADVRRQGYSRTQYGRIRPFPDLATASGPARQAAERQAMNAGIQGLAADVFKSSLVRLDHDLETRGLRARLILQVHDEVLVEAPPEEEAEVTEVILGALTRSAELSVPLEVSLHWGDNWAAAKG
jgi:DNA polymerase-1